MVQGLDLIICGAVRLQLSLIRSVPKLASVAAAQDAFIGSEVALLQQGASRKDMPLAVG